jgi:hypothetical protein
MVFWRETGTNDDDDEVEAREGACSMETAMAGRGVSRRERRAGGGDFVSLCARSRSGDVDQSASSVGELQREGPSSESRQRSAVQCGAVQRGLSINLGGSLSGPRGCGRRADGRWQIAAQVGERGLRGAQTVSGGQWAGCDIPDGRDSGRG